MGKTRVASAVRSPATQLMLCVPEVAPEPVKGAYRQKIPPSSSGVSGPETNTTPDTLRAVAWQRAAASVVASIAPLRETTIVTNSATGVTGTTDLLGPVD